MNTFWENKRVLVTGGAGFVGTHFLRQLLAQHAQVFAVCHTSPMQSSDKDICVFQGDLTEQRFCQNIFTGVKFDVVIHCAANTSGAAVIVNNPSVHIVNNICMNTYLLDAAAKSGVKHFIFMSSSTVYPNLSTPMKESQAFDDEPAPIYFGVGWMKRYTEKLCEFYHQQFGMQTLMLRPSQIIGSGMPFHEGSHMVPGLIQRALESTDQLIVWGSSDTTRDFIDAKDFVYAALHMMPRTGVMNIASGKAVTTQDIVNLILQSVQEFDHKSLTATYDSTKPQTIHTRLVNNEQCQPFLPSPLTALADTIRVMVAHCWAQHHA